MSKQRTLDLQPLQPRAVAPYLAAPVVNQSIYPAAPDPELIRMVYRKGDGIVNIVRRRKPTDTPGDDMYLLAAINAQWMPALFDQAVALAECNEDAFFQINPAEQTYRSTNKLGLVDHLGKPLHKPNTRAVNVKQYNAVWVDLDLHNIGLRFGDAVASVINAVDDGRLPQPSIALDSGRGCWFMWLLHGASPDLPAPRTNDNEKLWRSTMGVLSELFKDLAYDKIAKNVNRVCRIAGSLNPKVPKRVGYYPWLDATTGKTITYSLPDIAKLFGVELSQVPPIDVAANKLQRTDAKHLESTPFRLAPAPSNANKAQHKVKGGIRGYQAKWKALKANVYKLIQLRRVIRAGQREQTIFILANLISRLNRKHDNPVQDAIEEIARNVLHLFEQVRGDEITIAKIESITRSTYRNRRGSDARPMSEAYIADVLEITAAEEQALGGVLPRAGTKRPDVKVEQKKRAENRRNRRAEQQAVVTAMVKANHEKSGRVPTVTEIMANLTSIGMSEGASRNPCHEMQMAAIAELGIERKTRNKNAAATGPTLF